MPNETRIATWTEDVAGPHWSARKQFADWVPSIKLALALAFGLPFLGVMFGLLPNQPEIRNAFLFFTLPLGLIVMIWSVGSRKADDDEEPVLSYQLADGLPRMSAQIRLTIDGHVYGEDHGAFVLVDDWLVFEGRRTSFALAPHDVSNLVLGGRESEKLPVGLEIVPVSENVRLWIIHDDPRRDPREFLESWTLKAVPAPVISVLPPLAPMPGCSRKWLWRHMIVPTTAAKMNWRTVFVMSLIGQVIARSIVGIIEMHGLPLALRLTWAITASLAVNGIFAIYAGQMRGKALAKLRSTYQVLSADSVSQGLSPIPTLRAMELEAEIQSGLQ